MSRKQFTEEEQQLLRQNPYIFSVTKTKIILTKEFKEIFINACNDGKMPRKILEEHGFDLNILGKRRIWSILKMNIVSMVDFITAIGCVPHP